MPIFRVRISEIVEEAEGISSFTLVPVEGTMLPIPTAGAHIDIHLGSGLIRQYSLTNGPADTGHYRIAVKLEPSSRGGSRAMHQQVGLGDELNVSAPRNNFPLAGAARRHILLAGGIGITPLLSMSRWLAAGGAPFHLHYFARGPHFAAFAGWLSACEWRDAVDLHYGLHPDAQYVVLRELLAAPRPDTHLYTCGPGLFMAMVDGIAAQSGWDAGQKHSEYFSAAGPVEKTGEGFELMLACSDLALHVGPDQTIVEVLRAAGIEIETSCEEGICGTCMIGVLEGQPEHRDMYLSTDEQAEGRLIMPCVSRCRGDRLVLDL